MRRKILRADQSLGDVNVADKRGESRRGRDGGVKKKTKKKTEAFLETWRGEGESFMFESQKPNRLRGICAASCSWRPKMNQ